jgi:hypothetical protein
LQTVEKMFWRITLTREGKRLTYDQIFTLLNKMRKGRSWFEFRAYLAALYGNQLRRVAREILGERLVVKELDKFVRVELQDSLVIDMGVTTFDFIRIDGRTSLDEIHK